ncbi:hypothetical protein ACLBKU_02170 [Erythrobacter sp. NE805]|uniref:hypothetical protein n=1 Tax=Erythrobacter sp. NE805 TaxID=3389875 RepID=UPI00396B4165
MPVSVSVSNVLRRASLCLVAVASVGGAQTPSVPEGPDWSGSWRGELQNFPARPGAPRVEVRREVGAWPKGEGECSVFRTIYIEDGVEKGRKDYRLCRGATDNEFVVDEGGGVELKARLLGGKLVSTFKYGSILLVGVTQVEGDKMVEEIYSGPDEPAGEAVVSLQTRNLQRLTFRKVSE